MKIFNWIHRKLLPSINYSKVSQTKDVFGGEHEEKCEVIFEGVMEKEALIFHDVLSSILTIGTLGHQYNFLSQSYSMPEDILFEKEEENVGVEATGERKTVLPTLLLKEPLPLIESFRFKQPVEEEGKKMEMVMYDAEITEKNEELPLLKEEKEKRVQTRITLADLLAAEAIVMNDQSENANKEAGGGRLKQHVNISDRKKMQKNKKEEKWTSTTTKANTNSSSTSTTRLQKLITKVLKRKVHPAMVLAPNADGMSAK